MTRRLKVVLSYDGTAYHGFQRQGRGLVTIQDVLWSAIESTMGPPARFAAAGRTDAGVHAAGQVVAFDTAGTVPVERVPQALNSKLPADVSALLAEEVPGSFHPRFGARSKTYAYAFYGWGDRPRHPLLRRYALELPGRLDLEAMAEAALLLLGRHDFTALQDAGRPVRDASRVVLRCEVGEGRHELPPFLGLETGFILVEADGFLYHMVRALAGTLVEVGRGRVLPSRVAEILASRDRRNAGPTLPARGLCLLRVRY